MTSNADLDERHFSPALRPTAQIQNLNVIKGGEDRVLLRSVAAVTPGIAPGEYDRYDTQRMLSLTANAVGEDLGTAAQQIRAAVDQAGAPPNRMTVTVRDQIARTEALFTGLRAGLLAAVVVIFLLLAASFQSLRLSFVALSTVPGVLAGVVLALWLTGTPLNIQSFMGAIMAVGVAVANAILLVTFAERSRVEGLAAGHPRDASEAAVEGARSRRRPILMTNAAMIAGMSPMALGLGEGGQQTAPLGRAVIRGLAAATVATLLIQPSIFAIVQARSTARTASLDPTDPGSPYYDARLAEREPRR